jgi:hypothetical protein
LFCEERFIEAQNHNNIDKLVINVNMVTVGILVKTVTIKTIKNFGMKVATNIPTYKYIFMKSLLSLFYLKQRWNETTNCGNIPQHRISQIPSEWV